MNRNKAHSFQQYFKYFVYVLLFIIIVFALTVANYKFSRDIQSSVDFLHRWLPTRLVLFDGYPDIYSEEVSLQIQLVRYGRPAVAGEKPGLFAYPYYTVLLFLPFAVIENYNLSVSLFMTFLEIAHLAMILLSLKILHFQPPKGTFILLVIFSLFSADMISPLIYGNPVSFSALFSVLCLYFIFTKKDTSAGVFLALATFKPQSIFFFFLLVWLWAFSQRRWKIIYSSLLTLGLLLGVSFVLQPDWVTGFLQQILWYPHVASPNTPESILRGFDPGVAKWIANILSAAVLIILAVEWKNVYKKDYYHLLWTACLTCALLPLSGIASTKNNLIFCLPAVVLILAVMDTQPKKKINRMNVILLLSLFTGWVVVYLARNLTILVPYPNVTNLDLLVFPAFLITGLYIVRKTFLRHFIVESTCEKIKP